MRKLMILLAFVFTLSASAQVKGDWYVGTGDVANVSWTEWAISPTVGYAFSDDLVVGFNVSQEMGTDMKYDVHVRRFFGNSENQYFAYVGVEDFDTDLLQLGVGKMFSFSGNVYVDPRLVYNTGTKTTNLGLGVGLKF